jgi:hypothetical protein
VLVLLSYQKVEFRVQVGILGEFLHTRVELDGLYLRFDGYAEDFQSREIGFRIHGLYPFW